MEEAMSKTIKIAVLLIVTALVAGGVSYYLSRSTHANARVTVESIRRVAELATVEYRLAAILDQKYYSDMGFGRKSQTDYLIAIYTGAVRGHVDLENATVDIQKKADGDYVSIHFKRGSVVIYGVTIDPEKDHFEILTCQGRRPLFTKGANRSEYNALEKLALKSIIESAIKTGIVEKTKENAKTVLSDFVGALGYHAVVTFDEKAYDPPAPKDSERPRERRVIKRMTQV
jgi:hypothetical protein